MSMGKALHYLLTPDSPDEQRSRNLFAFVSKIVIIKNLDGHAMMSFGSKAASS